MYNSIQESKSKPLSRFVTALSIRHVGKETAELLTNELSTLEDLKSASLEQLSNIEGIGEKLLKVFMSFFHDEKNLQMIDEFQSLGFEFKVLNINKTDELA